MPRYRRYYLVPITDFLQQLFVSRKRRAEAPINGLFYEVHQAYDYKKVH
jgi:hypothetical protein